MKRKFLLFALFISCCNINVNANPSPINIEDSIAIDEFNAQNHSEEMLVYKQEGYDFMADNVLDTNNNLKQELLLQINKALSIGDLEMAESLKNYYDNINHTPYILSIYNDDIDIVMPEDKEILNDLQTSLETMPNN